MSTLLSFPNPVNEKAARVVAAGVAVIAAVILATGWQWLLVVLAYGFWARVLTGPTLSPLGRFATAVAAPRLGAPRYVAGPPKRFAQAIGAVVTTAAAICALALGWTIAATVLTALMVVFATLESVFAFCVGCRIFAALMAAGFVPDEICADCANIWA
jgi:small-conductance mechanosensitive channel